MRCSNDIQNSCGPKALDSINYAREVARCIVVSAISFANDQRQRLVIAIYKTIHKYHFGAVACLQHSRLLQTLHNLRQKVVVSTFTHDVIRRQQDIQHSIDTIEVPGALAHQQFPHSQCFVVATLQQHYASTSTLFEFVTRIKFGSCLPIERIQVTNREFVCGFGFTQINQVLNQHSERCSPVSNVVLTNHSVAYKLEHPHQRIANHRRPQMANVHFFCHVWCRVINIHYLWRGAQSYTQPRIGRGNR